MYKKAPQGMVAQKFTLSDPTIPVGTLVVLTGDMTVSATGAGPLIGELVAKELHGATPYGTVELNATKVLDVTAGAGGVTHGDRAKISGGANTVVTDAAGDLIILQGATAGNPAIAMFK